MRARAAMAGGLVTLAAGLSSACAAGWSIDQVFSNSGLVSLDQTELAKRQITTIAMGDVELMSGQIVAVDPLTIVNPKPLTRSVPPGVYPVTLYQAFGRIAAASLRFAEGKPDHWEIAVVAGQDPKTLKEGEIFGYAVDAGLGSFMDFKTLKLVDLRDKLAWLIKRDDYVSYYDDVLQPELAANHDQYALHRPMVDQAGNVAVFASGWGDGVYPSFWGLDASDKPLVLLTDFHVIKNADGSKEPKW